MKKGILADEALQFAIDNEEEAMAFYKTLSNGVATPDMKEVFLQLASEEKRHRDKLMEIRRSGRIPDIGKKLLDLDLSDYLVKVSFDAEIDLQQALAIAIEKETASYRLYTDLAAQVEDAETSEVFRFLAQEESKHKQRFEKEFLNKFG